MDSFSDFKKFCADNVSNHVLGLNEEGTIRFEWFIANDNKTVTFIERLKDEAAGEDREVVAAADIDGAFDVNGSLFDEALKASGALHVVFELVQHRCDARLLAWKRERSAVFVRRDGDGRVCRAVG